MNKTGKLTKEQKDKLEADQKAIDDSMKDYPYLTRLAPAPGTPCNIECERQAAKYEQEHQKAIQREQREREDAEKQWKIDHRTGQYGGRAEGVKGNVWFLPEGETQWRRLKDNQRLLSKDKVRTDTNSGVTITLLNGNVIRIGSGTVYNHEGSENRPKGTTAHPGSLG